MRVITLAAALSFLLSTAFAQTETPTGKTDTYAPATRGAAPELPFIGGPVPAVSTGPGLNIVGPDGVSTKTVKAVPCGVAARETDGTTTCVGISEGAKAKKR